LHLLHEFGANSPLKRCRNQCALCLADIRTTISCARNFALTFEKGDKMPKKTETRTAKKDKPERDLFCVLDDAFRYFAHRSSSLLGSALSFCGAVLVILVWLVTGPAFHFSDTWQLIINTATTVITFLMVFLIQNTQNRDAKAMHLKLDELIRAVAGARNQLVDLENLSDNELKKLEEQFQRLRKQAERGRTGSNNGQPARSR
jgi:low affinity Fe/Cu permease